ncbi:MAG: hypothetical protein ACE5HV_15270 [Acidobacteriota bacterium]
MFAAILTTAAALVFVFRGEDVSRRATRKYISTEHGDAVVAGSRRVLSSARDKTKGVARSPRNRRGELVVRFIVADKGNPIPDVWWAIEERPEDAATNCYAYGGDADGWGIVRMDLETIQAWRRGSLVARASGFKQGRFGFHQTAEDALALALQPEKPLARVSGVVMDEQGMPLNEAWIIVEGLVGQCYYGRTNEFGRFEVFFPVGDAERDRSWAIWAGLAGFSVEQRPVAVEDSEDLAIRLRRDRLHAVLRVVLLDRDGHPVPDVETRINILGGYTNIRGGAGLYLPEAAASSAATMRFVRRVLRLDDRSLRSNSDGSVVLWGVPPTEVRVRSRWKGYYVDAEVNVSLPDTTVVLRGRAGRVVRGRVTAGSDALAGAGIDTMEWPWATGKTDEKGEFVLRGLPTTGLLLRVSLGRGYQLRVPVPPSEGDTDIGTIALPAVKTIEGEVCHGDGSVVNRGSILVKFGKKAEINAPIYKGRFRLEGVTDTPSEILVRSEDRNRIYRIEPPPPVKPTWVLRLPER